MELAKLQLVLEGVDKGGLRLIQAQIKTMESLETARAKVAAVEAKAAADSIKAQTDVAAKVAAAETAKQQSMMKTAALATKIATDEAANASRAAAIIEAAEQRKQQATARTAIEQARLAREQSRLDRERARGGGGEEKGTLAATATALGKVAQGAFYVKQAFDTAASAAMGFFNAAQEGARVADMRAYFEASGKAIDDYRHATRGMISDQEIMAKSNLADTMGITGEQFKMLARIAQISSAKTGASFDHMFNSIIVGSARSSRLLLDNLGIIVSVEEANKRYAESLKEGAQAAEYKNLSVAQLIKTMSDEEKQLAFIQEVQRKAIDLESQAGDAAATSAEKFARFTAAIENLKTSIGEGLAGALGDVVIAITEMLDELKKMELSPIIAGILGGGAAGFALGGPFGALFGAYLGASDGLGKSMTAQDTAEAQAQKMREDQTHALDRIHAALVGIKAEKGFAPELFKKGEGYNTLLQTTDEQINSMKGLSVELVNAWHEFKRLNKETKMFSIVRPENAGAAKDDAARRKALLKAEQDKVNEKNAKMAEENDAFWRKQAAAHEKAMKRLDEQVANNQEAFAKDIADIDRAIRDEALKDMERAAKEGADKFEADIKRIDDAIAALDEAEKAFKSWLDSLASALLSAINGSPFQALLTTKMFGANNDKTLLGSMGGSIGSAIGGTAGGPVGGMIGDLLGSILGPALDKLKPVMTIITRVQEGLGKLIELGFGPMLNALVPLGDAAYQFLAALGPVVGALLGAFIPIVKMTVAISSFIGQIEAAIAIALSPFIDIFQTVITAIWALPVALVQDFIPQVMNVTEALSYFGKQAILLAVQMNNAIVEWIRTSTPLKDFGQMLNESDFVKGFGEALYENTDKTEANTEAVRDLTREFRNLPSGYKVEGATYAATAPTRRRRMSQGDFTATANAIMSEAVSWNDLRRWRT